MRARTKYLLIETAILSVFLYIVGTEVLERWNDANRLFGELKQKEQTITDPQVLTARRAELSVRKQSLASVLVKEAGSYDQSQMGVFEYLTSSARLSGVSVASLVPLEESQSSKGSKDINFKLSLQGSYHQIGSFINRIEMGGMRVRMSKLELSTANDHSSLLRIDAEGTATILPKKYLQ